MPELPEVEVVRRGLVAHASGRTIARVDVLSDRAVRRHTGGAADFAAVLAGRTITDVRRRGKYLWLVADQQDAIVAHLGMSGQFLVGEQAAGHRHLRVRLGFTEGPEIGFIDQRTFGGLSFSIGGAQLPDEISHIARDPLDPEFELEAAVAAIRARRTDIKRALLDQTVVSGIGNIYADEALWRARLHFARATQSLSRPAARTVLTAATDVMTQALAVGGTSFDSLYVNVNGESGYFSRSLDVYGQEGQPCKRCGSPIAREKFMNRSSHFCPRCQRRPRTRPAR